ncbi:MAG TPA: hypothetical protein VMI32_04920 [Candidatus Solibacter sp.]|nr:hypothetical protein [Candidatus Solibacter sp.]
MTPEELYAIWAPADSIWSPWILPVPFAELTCRDNGSLPEIPAYSLDWLHQVDTRPLAIVADLPGADAIHYGLALLKFGFRPVPVIDGSPGPSLGAMITLDLSLLEKDALRSPSVVDMRGLLLALCQGTKLLQHAMLAPDSPPAFLLDSKRMNGMADISDMAFDNRWMTFPQDFPSAKFLLARRIKKVVYVHESPVKQPQEDLAHVLRRWQEAGIIVENKSARSPDSPVPIHVNRPHRFRAAWYRALASLGLRRNDAGGFGGYPPDPSGAG